MAIQSIVPQSSTVIRITFTEPILEPVTVQCTGIYSITPTAPLTDLRPGLTVFSVTLENEISPTYLDLSIEEMCDGQDYNLSIATIGSEVEEFVPNPLIAEPLSAAINAVGGSATGGLLGSYRMVACLWVPYEAQVDRFGFGISAEVGAQMSWGFYQYADGEESIPGQPVPQIGTVSGAVAVGSNVFSTAAMTVKRGFLWVVHSLDAGTCTAFGWIPHNDTLDENMFLGGAVANSIPPTFSKLSAAIGVPATLDLTALLDNAGRGFPIVRFWKS